MESRKATSEECNVFLAGEQLTGVRFAHNDYVRITVGEHMGESGSLVSVEKIGDDPVFLLELETGFDTYVHQSQIELITCE